MRTSLAALLLLSTGCRDPKDTTTDTDTPVVTTTDQDGDGYLSDEDCDDEDKSVNPGAMETCDSVDNDCDGDVDEDVTTTFYADNDSDGFGSPTDTTEACEVIDGYVSIGNDCDDSDSETYPGAPERCDGIDNDCDEDIDEDVTTVWHADADADGYGAADSTLEECDPPAGYVSDDTDCDDLNPVAYPGAEEICDGADNDCDDDVDEGVTTTYYQDADNDNYGVSSATTEACTRPNGYAAEAGDCLDSDAGISPSATELCDGVDNNCDGDTDEDSAADASTWYADSDTDGYGDAGSTTVACEAPSGYTGDDTDCNDSAANANPGEAEVCDSIDNDCDGETDEDSATDASTWYADHDGDGYGGPSSTVACSMPSGFADNATDCNDSEASANPGETEICDDIDNDCDGDTDEGVTNTYYADADGDGYGSSEYSIETCDAPTGYVSDDTDCDDGEASANPGETEVCDDIDNNCDGDTDEDLTNTYYADADGDGYGSPEYSTEACEAPTGYVSDDTDCDDGESSANPGETEVCDDIDNNCDGDADEGVTNTYYADADGDGYGSPVYSTEACEAPTGYVSDDTDCDDGFDGANPVEGEICDGVDNDCNGSIDEGVTTTFYADADDDGFGDASDTTDACSVPDGYASDDTDCNDLNASAYPGAEEVCDEVDNDCDGDIDEDAVDGIGEWYVDSDEDGYGDPDTLINACEAPSGYTADNTDCNDLNTDINPAASEACNDEDDDCDGDIDEGLIGIGAECPAESCAEILAENSESTDGEYYLDVYSDGTVELYTCDMTTDGGGWTQIVGWDRSSNGDDWTDLESQLDTVYDNMSRKAEATSYIYWADNNSDADVLAYQREVPFENDGEIIVDLHYYGYSMDNSATFFYAETTAGLENILCKEDDDGGYNSTEYSYWPYICSSSADTTWTWNDVYQSAFSDEITAFHLRSFHWDVTGGDYSYLYRLNVSIR